MKTPRRIRRSKTNNYDTLCDVYFLDPLYGSLVLKAKGEQQAKETAVEKEDKFHELLSAGPLRNPLDGGLDL
jgi:hypothetical protein